MLKNLRIHRITLLNIEMTLIVLVKKATDDMNISIDTRLSIKEKIQLWKEQKGYLKKSVTLLELCDECNVNRTYMSNYINYTYHKNFNTWMNELRIRDASKLMLSSSHKSLNEIAMVTGYTDLAHFSKQFKALMGVPPSTWRREKKKEKKDLKDKKTSSKKA